MPDIDMYDYDLPGYAKLFSFQSWRVAMLNHDHDLDLENITFLEAHMLSDEAFVLLQGTCVLIIADCLEGRITGFKMRDLVPSKVAKVAKGVYHTHILSKDAKVLIIEEDSTDETNSSRIMLDDEAITRLRRQMEEKRHDL
jgi:hypothetical protein